jgi:hypothetical protein
MEKKRTKKQLQKLYDELGKSLVGVVKEKRRIEITRDFCYDHDLPFRRVWQTPSLKITKRLTRSLPKLPFK